MRPLLLIQTGEAPDPVRAQFGGFADWFRAAMRLQPAQTRVVRVALGPGKNFDTGRRRKHRLPMGSVRGE